MPDSDIGDRESHCVIVALLRRAEETVSSHGFIGTAESDVLPKEENG